MGIFTPKVIVKKQVYIKLWNHVCATDFQYETGGILLGYRYFGIFYIVAATFSEYQEEATRMTFVLNGEEHMQKMERERSRFCFPPMLIGVWHSHTTEDWSFSLQDEKSNELLLSQFGEILSIIITRKAENRIQLTYYFISEKNSLLLKRTLLGFCYGYYGVNIGNCGMKMQSNKK